MLGGRHGRWGVPGMREHEKGKFNPQVMRRLLHYLRPHAHSIMLSFLLILFGSIMMLATPYLIKVAIDANIAQGDMPGLLRTVLLILLTLILSAVGTGAQFYLVFSTGRKILAALRADTFAKLQQLSLSYFDQHEVGDIMSRIMNDVDTLNQLLTNGLAIVLSDILQLAGIVTVMLIMNWKLALLSFTVLPVMAVSTIIFARRAQVAYRRTREKIGAVSADLQESITGVRVAQSFAREQVNVEHFDTLNRENRDANIGAAIISSAFFPTVDILSAVASAIVLGAGGLLVLSGQLTVGVIVAFMSYVMRFFQPIRDLSNFYAIFQSAMAGGERVFGLMDEPVAIQDAPDAIVLPTLKGRIEFRHVSMSYRPGEPVLRDINLLIEPGQTVALVGPTGAGKTSIANLIGRFYDVDSGQVLVDGYDVRRVKLHSLRSQMGIVPQDSFLFSGTIADNIRYGRLDASDQEVEEAARLVNAHDFISRLPQGYDTPVMERGQNLSQGQRQLICFARAVLAQPRILILDEATSSVDTRTEMLIQNALGRLLKGRTSIVIAHRLSTIRDADQVLVIDGGRIVERGTHQSLLAARGLYYSLYMKQFATIEDVNKGIPHSAQA